MMVLRAPTVRFLYGATALLVAGCFDANAPSGPTPGSPGFDGLRAFGLVEKQVAFGPRVPGAPGHEAQLDWMLARLDSLAPEVLSDTFGHVSSAGDSLVLVNVMARFRPELDRRIVILTHWDTRPTSDEAADPARRSDPVPGANDGGSGTAVLLELAALMAETPPPLGIDLLFVDGEDFGPNGEDMYLGAKRYARQIAVGEQVGARPLYGLLLDMVGDADLQIYYEKTGMRDANTKKLMIDIWGVAARLGVREFVRRRKFELTDDHLPLIHTARIPTCDIIDYDYPNHSKGNIYWHTEADTLDKCSALSLAKVGYVVHSWLKAINR